MADNANNRWMKLAEDVGKFAFSHLMDSVHVPLVKHQQSSKSVFIMLFKKREKWDQHETTDWKQKQGNNSQK